MWLYVIEVMWIENENILPLYVNIALLSAQIISMLYRGASNSLFYSSIFQLKYATNTAIRTKFRDEERWTYESIEAFCVSASRPPASIYIVRDWK